MRNRSGTIVLKDIQSIKAKLVSGDWKADCRRFIQWYQWPELPAKRADLGI